MGEKGLSGNGQLFSAYGGIAKKGWHVVGDQYIITG